MRRFSRFLIPSVVLSFSFGPSSLQATETIPPTSFCEVEKPSGNREGPNFGKIVAAGSGNHALAVAKGDLEGVPGKVFALYKNSSSADWIIREPLPTPTPLLTTYACGEFQPGTLYQPQGCDFGQVIAIYEKPGKIWAAVASPYNRLRAPGASVPGDQTHGSVFMYEFVSNAWVYRQELKPTGILDVAALFGSMLTFNDSGHLLIGTSQGKVFTAVHNGHSWVVNTSRFDLCPSGATCSGGSLAAGKDLVAFLPQSSADFNRVYYYRCVVGSSTPCSQNLTGNARLILDGNASSPNAPSLPNEDVGFARQVVVSSADPSRHLVAVTATDRNPLTNGLEREVRVFSVPVNSSSSCSSPSDPGCPQKIDELPTPNNARITNGLSYQKSLDLSDSYPVRLAFGTFTQALSLPSPVCATTPCRGGAVSIFEFSSAQSGFEQLNLIHNGINPDLPDELGAGVGMSTADALMGAPQGNYNSENPTIGHSLVLRDLRPTSSSNTCVCPQGLFPTSSGCAAQSPIAIANQPQDQTANVGQRAFFSVNASTNTGTLTYQWLLNGNALQEGGNFSGTRTSQLQVLAAPHLNNAQFSVSLSANGTTMTSEAATLTVQSPPSAQLSFNGSTITGSLSRLIRHGDPVTINLTVSAGLPQATTVEWLKAGSVVRTTSLTQSGNDSFSIPSFAASHAGLYTVRVSNAVGSVNAVGSLQLNYFGLISEPQDASVTASQRVSFSGEAVSSEPITYQWLQEGNPISDVAFSIHGTRSKSLAFNAVSSTANGRQYSLRATSGGLSITSRAARLTVFVAPSLQATQLKINGVVTSFTMNSSIPIPPEALVEISTNFVNGNPEGGSITWLRGYQSVQASGTSYVIPSFSAEHVGDYFIEASNGVGVARVGPIRFILNGVPALSTETKGIFALLGASSTISVAPPRSSSLTPTSYRWERRTNASPETWSGTGLTWSSTTGALSLQNSSSSEGVYRNIQTFANGNTLTSGLHHVFVAKGYYYGSPSIIPTISAKLNGSLQTLSRIFAPLGSTIELQLNRNATAIDSRIRLSPSPSWNANGGSLHFQPEGEPLEGRNKNSFPSPDHVLIQNFDPAKYGFGSSGPTTTSVSISASMVQSLEVTLGGRAVRLLPLAVNPRVPVNGVTISLMQAVSR